VIFQNFASGTLTADPGDAGTTLTSGQFANLAAVAAPETMRLALDPDGLAGVPEIVIVTAHTAFATTCTVTRGQEADGANTGPARAHAVDSIWRHVMTRAVILEMLVPAGSIIATVKATPDPGYVFIDGSTIVNGQVRYPAAWAAIPTSWKSAPDIVLPDWRGRFLVSDDTGAVFTLGAVGGSNTHAISQAELPAVSLTIDPPNTVISIDPPNTAVTGSTGVESAPHAHSALPGEGGLVNSGGGAYASSPTGGTDLGVETYTDTESVQHTHPAGTLAVNIAPFNVNVDIAPFASPNLGSGTAMSMLPAHAVVNYALKVH
jgi:hypothetical protein